MMNPIGMVQQQQQAGAGLSIDQLLRAAKLIEQRAIVEKMMVQPSAIDQLLLGNSAAAFAAASAFSATKLGEDYEERMLASKMRNSGFVDASNAFGTAAPNSTGSSRRSSPISASSSAPNSPGFITPMAQQAQQQQPQQATTSANLQQQNGQQPNNVVNVRASSSASSSASNNGNGGRRVSGSRQSRAAHNELEKNRRANLRGHLEALKSVLPPEADTHRDTTLSLLTRARNYIQFNRDQKAKLAERRSALLSEHLHLRQLLQQQQNANVGCGMQLQQQQQREEEEELPAPKPIFSTAPMLMVEEEEEVIEEKEEKANHLSQNGSEETQENAKIGAINLDMDFCALHGLLPALPRCYPYTSSSSSAAMLPNNISMEKNVQTLC